MDLSLYLVTDRPLSRGRPIEEIVSAAIAGGVTTVQLREKDTPTGEFLELALRMRTITRESEVTFIVNDRLDIALASDADGIHVGQDDMPADVTRRLIGPDRILGVTAGDSEQARTAIEAGADYIGCNAVFATHTKTDTGIPLGLAGLEELVRSVDVPVVAIGGINITNAAEVLATGVAGIAVVSAIVAADDPEKAARELKHFTER
ncbi:thiamine phosphate synthase [Gemmatimonadota bacterium]